MTSNAWSRPVKVRGSEVGQETGPYHPPNLLCHGLFTTRNGRTCTKRITLTNLRGKHLLPRLRFEEVGLGLTRVDGPSPSRTTVPAEGSSPGGSGVGLDHSRGAERFRHVRRVSTRLEKSGHRSPKVHRPKSYKDQPKKTNFTTLIFYF